MQKEHKRRKRRRIWIILLATFIVISIVPQVRDRLQARAYIQSLAPGMMLEASPFSRGELFRNTRILLLHHDDDGSVGIVLNQSLQEGQARTGGAALATALAANADGTGNSESTGHYWGGPVHPQQRIVVSKQAQTGFDPVGGLPIYATESNADFAINDFTLNAIAGKHTVFHGYAGWRSGQLAHELRRRDWRVYRPKPAPLLDALQLEKP